MTRTYARIYKELLEQYFENIHGLVIAVTRQNVNAFPTTMRIVDNLFRGSVLKIVRASGVGYGPRMYQVFNMGHKSWKFYNSQKLQMILSLCKTFDVERNKVIGRIEKEPP